MRDQNIKETNIILPFKPSFTVRVAEEQDVAMIKKFISMLPEYEAMLHGKILTDEILNQLLFLSSKENYIILVYKNKNPIGFSLYSGNTIFFVGRPDLRMDVFCMNSSFVKEERGQILFQKLAYTIGEGNHQGMEWWCLIGKA